MGFLLESTVIRYEVKYLLSFSVTAVESKLGIDITKIEHNKYVAHTLVWYCIRDWPFLKLSDYSDYYILHVQSN